jgi:hypothetical protein
MSTIEYEAVSAAHRRANQHAQKIAQEPADNAARKETDPDKAIQAFDCAWEITFTPAWQNAYDQFLPQEYKRLSAAAPKGQLKEPLTPRSSRRF